MEGSRRMSRRVSYKKQAILGTMLLLVIVAAVEGAALAWAHLFDSELCDAMKGDAADGLDVQLKRQICDDSNGLLYMRVEGGYKMIRPDQHYPTISINSHGFRGPEFEVQKPEGAYRVFVIGGSSAFGAGTADNATIPAHLERMYRESELPFRVEVINAGIPGGQSYIEHMLVRDRILGMDPDLLIVYDGYNDIVVSINNPGIGKPAFQKGTRDGTFSKIYDAYLYWKSVYETVKKHSKIIYYAERHALQDDKSYDDSPVLPKVAVWKERWSEICDIGRERGFHVLVTVQPVLGSGNQTMTAYHEALYTEKDGAFMADGIRHYADALDGMSSSCSHTLDLTHAFDGHIDDTSGVVGEGGRGGGGGGGKVPTSSVAMLDRVHLSDYGNMVIASKMYEASVPIITSGPAT